MLETETVSVDTMIITFSATDDDQPNTNNSRVFYYADQRDDNQLLVLNSTTVWNLYCHLNHSDIEEFLYRENCIFLLEEVWIEIELILIKHQIAELFTGIKLKEETKGIHPFRVLLM